MIKTFADASTESLFGGGNPRQFRVYLATVVASGVFELTASGACAFAGQTMMRMTLK